MLIKNADPICAVSVPILIILRNALREKGKIKILTEEEYDALLHVSATIRPYLDEDQL